MRRLLSLVGVFILGWLSAWAYLSQYSNINSPSVMQPESLKPSESKVTLDQQPSTKDATVSTKKAPESEFDITQNLLIQGDYDAVMLQYTALQGRLGEAEFAGQRNLILDHVRSLGESGHHFKARMLLMLYLNVEFNDVEGLELLALINRRENHRLAEIEALYKAKSYAHTTEKLRQLSNTIRLAVNQYKANLNSQKDHIALLDLYQRLTELEPEYAAYYIGLAEAYLALGNKADARTALQLTLHEPAIASRANALILMIDKSPVLDSNETVDIPLIVAGNQFLVKALLNDQQHAVLLLDTGASLSIISTALLSNLGLSYQHTNRTGWFNTANGRVQAPIVRIDSLSLGDQTVKAIEVAVIDLPSDNLDGLLGMNFLRHFDFFIDQDNHILRLSVR